ncbi:MAG TPA: ABC transporter ATP-binding protein [Chthoniobacterales bacterium]
MGEELTISLRKGFSGGLEIECGETLHLGDARTIVLFGPSASGKSTLLRCIAGLERPDAGRICMGGEIWFDPAKGVDQSPRKRGIGYVTQESALFPHLDVRANVEFGLARMENVERGRRCRKVSDALRIAPLLERRIAGLSGGEKQRVALARTLAPRPRLLLLDEPFSALDIPARISLRGELRDLLRMDGIPSILVTHDRSEAMALADEILILSEGRVVQRGTAAEVFNFPATAEVAGLVGIETVLQAQCESRADGLLGFRTGETRLVGVDAGTIEAGQEALLCIRAEDVILTCAEDSSSSPRNRMPVRVMQMEPDGAMVRLTLDAGFPLKALLTRQASAELGLEPGSRAWAAIKAPQIHIIPRR